jgi:hypothetical protein
MHLSKLPQLYFEEIRPLPAQGMVSLLWATLVDVYVLFGYVGSISHYQNIASQAFPTWGVSNESFPWPALCRANRTKPIYL